VSFIGRHSSRGGVIEITEVVEEPIVNKRARVTEEVVLYKEAKDRVETVHDTARHTDVAVEHAQPPQESDIRGFDTYEADSLRHFSRTFAQQPGAIYDTYMPAYRYGYILVPDKRYNSRDWATFESEARRDWGREHSGTWERFKGAIQHARDEILGRRKGAKDRVKEIGEA
jgi:hypothetical protein